MKINMKMINYNKRGVNNAIRTENWFAFVQQAYPFITNATGNTRQPFTYPYIANATNNSRQPFTYPFTTNV